MLGNFRNKKKEFIDGYESVGLKKKHNTKTSPWKGEEGRMLLGSSGRICGEPLQSQNLKMSE